MRRKEAKNLPKGGKMGLPNKREIALMQDQRTWERAGAHDANEALKKIEAKKDDKTNADDAQPENVE